MAFVVRIERIIPGGRGLGFLQGKPVFVPSSVPGDRVLVKSFRDRTSYLEARDFEVLEPSSSRVQPPCRYFGECGGCDLQQIDYQHQLLAKRDILIDALKRVGKINFPPDRVLLTASPPWGYRNRLHLKASRQGEHLSLGFFRLESHDVVALESCLIASSSLWQVICQLRSRIEACSWLCKFLSGLQIFEGDDQRYLVNLEFDVSDSETAKLREVILEEDWRFEGADISFSITSNTGMLMEVSGARFVHRTVGNVRYRVSQGSFFQINDFMLEKLRELAIGCSKGELALDLYSGVGFFTLALATRYARVMAVESHPVGCRDLQFNLDLDERQVFGCEFFPLEVSEFLDQYQAGLGKVDLVVLDPPRVGASVEIVKKIACLRATEVVYVSCDPATLARDLKVLLEHDYEIAKLDVLDLFPQTHHLESVVRLYACHTKQLDSTPILSPSS